MIKVRVSRRFVSYSLACTIGLTAAGLNAYQASVAPLDDWALDSFVLEWVGSASTAEVANAITVQNAVTGDVIAAPAPAREYYARRIVTDVLNDA